jgi:hypothetical protein
VRGAVSDDRPYRDQHLAQQCFYVARRSDSQSLLQGITLELSSTREGAVHTKSPLTRKSFGRFRLKWACPSIMLTAPSVLGSHGHIFARPPPSSVPLILSTFAGSGFFLLGASLTG